LYRSSIRTIGLWIIGIVLFSFAVHRGIVVAHPSIGECTSSYITYPFLRICSAIINPITHWCSERALAHDLLVQHKRLLDDYATLQQEYIRCRAKQDMYDDTQDLITFNNISEEKGHIAQIMMRYISDQSHYYLVDAGSEHGIEPDMVALYKECLVGRVTHVYPYYCKVVLVTDALCKISAYCSETKTTGIHEGLNNTRATTLRHVSHLASMQNDDLVLSSGEGLIFPRGYSLGTVETHSHDGLLYSITIKAMLDFNTLQYCLLTRRGALRQAQDERN